VLRLEGEPLAKLQEVCDQTRNLIGDGNQMWQIEVELLYDQLVKDYFEIIKELSSKL